MTTRQEFSNLTKLTAWKLCKGYCVSCDVKILSGSGPEYDHITPAAIGGSNGIDNCQVLCKFCHSKKTTKTDVPQIAKGKRLQMKAANIKTRRGRPMGGTIASGLKKHMDGRVTKR